MFCGTGSFKRVVVDNDDPEGAGGSPKQPRRKHGGGGKANPYAERGLDKFTSVLSELETRRSRILRRVGSDSGLVMVRFVHSNGGAWEPIVVKVPDEQRTSSASKKPKPSAAGVEPARPAAASSTTQPDPASPREAAAAKDAVARRASASKAPARSASSFSWERMMQRPARYWAAAMVVLILMVVCLTLFGRVFAICFTSIWWYLAPTLSSGCGPVGAGAGAGEDTAQAALRRSTMEKRKVSAPLPAHEVVSSPRSHAKRKFLRS